MTLFFIYDTTYSKQEEDDPKNAVLYFFPEQESGSQHFFLCCQLAGIAKFFKSAFSTPSIIGLDQGKFAFLCSGRYLIVLGSNSDIPDSILQERLSFLSGIFCCYYGSMNKVLEECKDTAEFIVKLEFIWTRLISFSQSLGSLFSFTFNASTVKPIKKKSTIVSATHQLLQTCQISSSVIAGAVYLNNKVLSTQFPPQLTGYSSFLLSSNIAAQGFIASSLKHLPPGVELKVIYLSLKSHSNILKYNHTYAGSRLRVKSDVTALIRTHLVPTFNENTSSGSEGDIDSGNRCEIFYKHKSIKSKLCKHYPSKHKKFYGTFCCTSHSKQFLYNQLKSRNFSCLKHIQRSSTQSKYSGNKDLGFHSRASSTEMQEMQQSSLFKGVYLLCSFHATCLATNFAFESKLSKHTHFSSIVDAEYMCPLCSKYDNTFHINKPSLKKWNSEVNMCVDNNCSCDLLLKVGKLKQVSPPTAKLQVLKCRRSSDPSSKLRSKKKEVSNHLSRKQYADLLSRSNSDNNSNSLKFKKSTSVSHPEELIPNIEENQLKKHVLYVHKFGSYTVVLLLSKSFDDKVINYLWNTAFSVLRNLEFRNDKSDNIYDLLDPSFHALLYNHDHNTLKEYPKCTAQLLTGKNSRTDIQKIQGEFLTFPSLKSLCLLSWGHSIFSVSKYPEFAFYLQPEVNTCKIDSLSKLCNKAIRRLEKCVHF